MEGTEDETNQKPHGEVEAGVPLVVWFTAEGELLAEPRLRDVSWGGRGVRKSLFGLETGKRR